MINLEVVVLGSGCATPIPERWHASFAVLFDGEPILFDAGEGAQIRLQQAKINAMRVNHIFITHLHGDHWFGLPGLIFTMDLQGRKKPLTIHGPSGLRTTLRRFLASSEHGVKFPLKFHEVPVPKTGRIPVVMLEEERFKVLAVPINHTIAGFSYAFVEKDGACIDKAKLSALGIKKKGPFLEDVRSGRTVTVEGIKVRPKDILIMRKGRKIAISGDTRPTRGLISLAKGARLLVHEATYTDDLQETAVSHKHSTISEAANVAKSAKVEELLLVHFSKRYAKLESVMLAAAKKTFRNTVIGEDLLRIKL